MKKHINIPQNLKLGQQLVSLLGYEPTFTDEGFYTGLKIARKPVACKKFPRRG
jgi:hypothetical protein